MPLIKRFQIWRMKSRARKFAHKASYRSGDGGRHITNIISGGEIEHAETEYKKCISWLREHDLSFPKEQTNDQPAN